MKFRFLVTTWAAGLLAVTAALGQGRDYRAERLVLDDNNGNTVIIQTPTGPITGGTLTIPDPNGTGQFVISNPSGGSQSVSGDFLPGTDDTYDLGSGAERWQDIFLSGIAAVAGAIQFQETGGGTDYVGFQAPAAVATSQIWTLPAADGTSGQLLSTDGSGVLNWTTISGTVNRNATLTGDGSVGSPLGINLGNSNTWTANQTFGGTFVITANSRIAMTNSDNNARDIRFQEPSGTGSQYIGLRAPSVTNNGNYVLPAVMGSAGEVLTLSTSNGIDSGTLAWAAGGASGTAGGDLTGTYPNPTIANDAITSAKIQDGQVQNSDLSANSVTTSKVANGTVTTSKMADSAISGLKLLTFAVTNRHLASNAVTPDKVDPTGAASGDVLTYNGTNVVWTAAAGGTVTHNATLTGNGTGASPLGINLGNSNTWTANQTFAGTFLITANSRIAMTNSDNNARDIRFQEPSGTGSQYIGLRAPSVTNNGNYVFPAVMGTAGQVLTLSASNGIDSGTMAWTTPGGGGSVTVDSTMIGDGSGGSPLGLDLAQSNVWTATISTFTGFLESRNEPLVLTNTDNSANEIRIQEASGNGSNFFAMRADTSITTNDVWIMPSTAGTAGQVLGITAVNTPSNRYYTLDWKTPTAAAAYGYTTYSANATLGTTDEIVGATTSGGAITLTLPAANSVPAGKFYIINNESSPGGNNLTIARAGTDLIDGGTSTVISGTLVGSSGAIIYSNGVNAWFRVP